MSNATKRLIPYAGKEPPPQRAMYRNPQFAARPLFDQIAALQRQGMTTREAAESLGWPNEFAQAVVLAWLYRPEREVSPA